MDSCALFGTSPSICFPVGAGCGRDELLREYRLAADEFDQIPRAEPDGAADPLKWQGMLEAQTIPSRTCCASPRQTVYSPKTGILLAKSLPESSRGLKVFAKPWTQVTG
jgi:hypothetical protein